MSEKPILMTPDNIVAIEKEADKWTGCYEGGWNGVIVPDAFSHPAKFSYSLTERMFGHAIRNGWIWPSGNVTVTKEILAELQKDVDNGQYQQLE